MPRKTSRRVCQQVRRDFRFNEAAARCRGKLTIEGGQSKRDRASMRPRPDAAENLIDGRDRCRACELLQ